MLMKWVSGLHVETTQVIASPIDMRSIGKIIRKVYRTIIVELYLDSAANNPYNPDFWRRLRKIYIIRILMSLAVILLFTPLMCMADRLDDRMTALKPVVAIDMMMKELVESQGQELELIKLLEQDPGDDNQLVLEYSVTSEEGADNSIYQWAYRSTEGIKFNSFDQLVVFSREDNFELVPVSECAEDIHNKLEQYLQAITKNDINLWTRYYSF